MINTIDYNYDQYTDDIGTLHYKLSTSSKKYDLIVGVERGGLIPAVHLSHLLGVPMTTLKWSTRDAQVKDISRYDIASAVNSNILVVDDIVDEGHTAQEICQVYPHVDFACLIYNCVNRYSFVPTYCGWTINRETTPQWFNFWWEKQ